ncbi:insulinase family protein [bacterium]|nr:insulinase family protein [bacterium]
MNTKTLKLKNNTEVFFKKNPNTPRIALCLNLRSPKRNKEAGLDVIMARLFMQGTKNRSAEDIANELDAYAIEFSTDVKPDYIRLKFVCLNEDFGKALEILTDIIKNSTFDDFDKELVKMEGEIIADLDSPRAKTSDKYYSTIFDGHNYGCSSSKVLENIKNLTKAAVIQNYNNLINESKKVITVVGDIDFDKVEAALNDNLSDLPASQDIEIKSTVSEVSEDKYAEIIKPDANQAHIIKGWITDSFKSDDYPALLLLNVILGSSGLSSRLFLELRDKKGLAYVVRSCYEAFGECADFYIYIATEPKNIEVSLAGFKEELEKIQNIPVGTEELENAKNNMLGKWAFTQETNENQAILYGSYGILNLGFDFNDRAKERLKSVTAEQVQECAKKYFSQKSVLAVLKP